MDLKQLKLYSCSASFYSQKVLLALAEKGVPYEKYDINLGQYENYSSWYIQMNPKGQVPMLEADGKYITESTEIIEYLDEVCGGPPLLPSHEKEKWEHFLKVLDDVDAELLTYGAACYPQILTKMALPNIMQRKMRNAILGGERRRKLQQFMEKATNPDVKDLYKKKIEQRKAFEEAVFKNEDSVRKEFEKVKRVLEEVNQELENRKGETWLVGPDFTIADICLAILLHRLKFVGYAADLWEDGKMPYIEAYYARVLKKDTFMAVCVDGVTYFNMMRYVIGGQKIALFFGTITALIISVGVGLYMARNK